MHKKVMARLDISMSNMNRGSNIEVNCCYSFREAVLRERERAHIEVHVAKTEKK